MFNHLYLQGKCTYVTFIHHVFSGLRKSLCISILYQSVVGIFGKFPNQHLYWSKFWLLIGKFASYNRNFNFCPSCQSNLFLVTQFMLAILEILPLAPILCSNLWLVVLLNGKFLLFLSLFGTLAIKAMAFWEISIFSQQNLSFLKSVKWVM